MKLKSEEFLDVLKSYLTPDMCDGKLTDSVSASVNVSLVDNDVYVDTSDFKYNQYIEYLTYSLILCKRIAFIFRVHTNQYVDEKRVDEVYSFMIYLNEKTETYNYEFFNAFQVKEAYGETDAYLVFCDKSGERIANWI